jgi:hypothetical protein
METKEVFQAFNVLEERTDRPRMGNATTKKDSVFRKRPQRCNSWGKPADFPLVPPD